MGKIKTNNSQQKNMKYTKPTTLILITLLLAIGISLQTTETINKFWNSSKDKTENLAICPMTVMQSVCLYKELIRSHLLGDLYTRIASLIPDNLAEVSTFTYRELKYVRYEKCYINNEDYAYVLKKLQPTNKKVSEDSMYIDFEAILDVYCKGLNNKESHRNLLTVINDSD